MAEALIQILIVIFSVLLLGGTTWMLFWRNPRRLSLRRLAEIDAANTRRHDAPADRADLKGAYAIKRLSVQPFLFWLERFLFQARAFGLIRILSTFLTDRSLRRDINSSKF